MYHKWLGTMQEVTQLVKAATLLLLAVAGLLSAILTVLSVLHW